MGQREMLYIKSLNRNTTGSWNSQKQVTFYKYNKINCQNNQSHFAECIKDAIGRDLKRKILAKIEEL